MTPREDVQAAVEAVETDYVIVRSRLDYPSRGGNGAYIAALEALDRLAESRKGIASHLAAETARADAAVKLGEHLFQMIDRETWRATGGDDGQGHYEGDYLAEQVRERLAALARYDAAKEMR